MGGCCCILGKDKPTNISESENSEEEVLYDGIKSSNMYVDEYINNNWEKIEWDDNLEL